MLSRVISIEEILKRHEEILQEHTRLLREHSKILEEHTRMLQEHGNKLDEHGKTLQSHTARFDELTRDVQDIKKTLSQVNRTLQKLTYSIEDEAIDVVSWKLREKLGVNVKLGRLVTTEDGREVLELNIYGTTDDLCIIGDATLDLRIGRIEELIKVVNELRNKSPQYLRPRVIKVLYCMRYVPEAIEEAKKNNIWVLTWREELTPFTVSTT